MSCLKNCPPCFIVYLFFLLVCFCGPSYWGLEFANWATLPIESQEASCLHFPSAQVLATKPAFSLCGSGG